MPPVGQQPKRNYYSVNKDSGKIRYKDGDGNEHFYDFIEGLLTKIELKEEEYQGEETNKYRFYLEDADRSQVDVFQVGEASSAARGIIMSLFSIPKNEPIRFIYIRPYTKEGDDGRTYINVWFMRKSNPDDHWIEKEDWDPVAMQNVPETVVHNIGQKTHIDDTARRDYYRQLANRVRRRLAFPEENTGPILRIQQGDQMGKATQQNEPVQPSGVKTEPEQQVAEPAVEKGPEKPQKPAQNKLDEQDVKNSPYTGFDPSEDVDDDLPF